MKKGKTFHLKTWILTLSILLNIFFGLNLALEKVNSPNYKLGVLTQDVNVGFFANDSTIFKLPKGIIVRNVSPRGVAAIGQFENHRFEIIVTTDKEDLVNYNLPKNNLSQNGNYYSADKSAGTVR